jgi:mercuric ion transport protein
MMKERAVVGGAVVTGLLASLCCVGPLLFVLLGVSAFGAATAFESARPYLLAGSVLLLALGYYWTYFRRGEACSPGGECATKPAGRVNRVGLWVASIAVLAFAGMPYFAGPLAAKLGEQKTVTTQPEQEDCCVAQKPGGMAAITPGAVMEKATFKVEGMTCASCETTIKLALERTPGVGRAEVSYDRGEAVVEYDPKKTTQQKLRDAINSTGYTVKEGK